MMRLVSAEDLSVFNLIGYGIGGMGAGLLRSLRRWDVEPAYFVDSSRRHWGRRFEGVEVISPEAAAAICREDSGLIIVASSFYREISDRLRDLGLEEGKDFFDASRFAIKEEFEEDESRLAAHEGKHLGKRAFLVGNGPSLRMEDLDRLKGEICFAANKIYLAYDSTDWRPSYYCCCDPQVSVNIQDRIRELDTTTFLANSTCFYGERLANGFVLPYFFRNRPPMGSDPRFSEDPIHGVYDGGTVVYMMMQLAWFMGVREIYLIGMDHSFKIPDGRKGELLEGGGRNHFHPDYRPKEEYWSVPDFEFMDRSFAYAARFFEERGGRVANVSRKSALSVFDRLSLDSVLSGDV